MGEASTQEWRAFEDANEHVEAAGQKIVDA